MHKLFAFSSSPPRIFGWLCCLFCVVVLNTTVSLSQIEFFESSRRVVNDISLGPLAISPTRTIIDLNGAWQYREDEEQPWKRVNIPASYTGNRKVTFTRDFTIDARTAHRSVFQLYALSISYYCEIKINDQFIGKHADDVSFSFKISPGIIRAGRNTITIDVHNILNARETIPLSEQLWNRKNYGGIIYDIALIANGAVWVQETSVRTSISGEGKPAVVEYQALLNSGQLSKLKSDSASFSLTYGKSVVDHYVELVDPQTDQPVFRSETKSVTIESDRLVPVNLTLAIPAVRLWSPETPYLYILRQRTFRGSTLIDESYTQIGFRSFKTSEKKFSLNGNPYFLKGVTYTEDSPRHGRSLSMDELERDVLMIKNLGANTIRLIDGSVHPYLLSLCDRYGLLVMQDLPVFNAPSYTLGQTALQSTARNVLRELSVRDFNHPSVVAWGIALGVDGSQEGFEEYFESVGKVARGAGEHLLYASFLRVPAGGFPEALDFFAVDIFHVNSGTVSKILKSVASRNDDKPVMISSVCYPVEIGNYNGYSDPRSIDAQGQFFLEIYSEVRSLNYAGIAVNSFADWSVSIPLMSVDRTQQYTATVGIVDAYRQKRIAYDVLKAKFNNEKAPVLVIGNHTPELPPTFVIFGIFVILVFAVVYNLFRRFRENVVRSFLRPYNFYTDVRDQRMLSIFQTSVVGIIGSVSAALILANLMYFWKTNPYFDYIVSQFFRDVWLKQWINFAAWNPLANILVMTVFFFTVLVLFALFLKAISFFLKKNVLMFDAYSVSMWSALPMAFLAPFGMILYRIMDIPILEILAIAFTVIFHIWIISRLLKGTSIVLDNRPLYFYFGGYGAILIGAAVWLLSLNNQHEIFAYLRYIFDIWSYMLPFAA